MRSLPRLGLILALALPTGGSAQSVPYLPITDFLPPLVAADPALDYAEVCGADGVKCLSWVEEQLAGWEQFFGCDHRAVFPTVYKMLTRQARLQMEEDPTAYDDPAGLGFEAILFYELFEEMITAHLADEEIPPAWQVAMDAANTGDWTGLHDMLLAINAHVQRDMPFAIAAVGLNLPDGSSRKRDHDQFNRVLNDAYGPIVQEVGRRYDPMGGMIDDLGGPVDDLAAQQLIAVWREGVWRNAERVEATHDTPLWPVTLASIELQAELTARVLKNGPIPGRRALRRAHCEAVLAAEAAAAEPPAAAGGGGGLSWWWLLLAGVTARRQRP